MSITVRTLISEAFREAGVLGLGVALSAEDFKTGLWRLQFMLAQWQTKRYLVYSLVNHTIESTGTTGYTVGPTGDITIAERPSKIVSAFFQKLEGSGDFSNDFDDDFNTLFNGNVDVPLTIIPSREDYNQLRIKRRSGSPALLYYEPTFPNGTFYLWPVPPALLVNLTVTFRAQLQALPSLNTTIILPGEYHAALLYNLALRLCATYRKPVAPELAGLAKDGLDTIRKANTQVPLLSMPSGLAGMRKQNYDAAS